MNSFFRDPEKYRAYKVYYRAYGGWQAVLTSPYFAVAFLIWCGLHPIWLDTPEEGFVWLAYSFSTLPALLGFSLGSISILLAFSSETFQRLAHKERDPASYYMQVTATFFHFILMQFVALILSIMVATYEWVVLSGFGCFVFLYALLSGIAAAAALLGAADILDKSRRVDVKKTESNDSQDDKS